MRNRAPTFRTILDLSRDVRTLDGPERALLQSEYRAFRDALFGKPERCTLAVGRELITPTEERPTGWGGALADGVDACRHAVAVCTTLPLETDVDTGVASMTDQLCAATVGEFAACWQTRLTELRDWVADFDCAHFVVAQIPLLPVECVVLNLRCLAR